MDPGTGQPEPDAGPDISPDAPNSCSDNSHCPADRQQCSESQCVACTVDQHCTTVGTTRCTVSKTCVQCLVNTDCGGGDTPLCTPENKCVECLSHDDCESGEFPLCSSGACVPCGEGGGSAACAEKTDNALPICVSNGSCAQCGRSTDCKVDDAPICAQNKCIPCTRDSECSERDGDEPGICLAPRDDGRCAKDEETIYVQNANPCSMAGGEGTRDMPFCQPANALRAISSSRRVLRLRGPVAGALDIETSGPIVSIIGQEGAVISSATDVGILVRSGDVYIRGLEVVASRGTGVVVRSGSTLRLNRAVVKANLGGGLQVASGAGFDISNSVFAGNIQGGIGPGRFGGVSLGSPGNGRPGVFRANTVVYNEDIGVLCPMGAQQRLVGVLLSGNVAGDQFNCNMPSSSRMVADPKFMTGRAFHIDRGAPCENAASASEMPKDDLDGEPRPYPTGSRSDCGADEFHPSP